MKFIDGYQFLLFRLLRNTKKWLGAAQERMNDVDKVNRVPCIDTANFNLLKASFTSYTCWLYFENTGKSKRERCRALWWCHIILYFVFFKTPASFVFSVKIGWEHQMYWYVQKLLYPGLAIPINLRPPDAYNWADFSFTDKILKK